MTSLMWALWLLVGACGCDGETKARDAGDPDAAATPSGAVDPSADTAAPPLFDPTAPGATPLDAPIAALLEAWHELPTDEVSAQAHVQRMQGALSELRASGAAAADRITDVCATVPVHVVGSTLECLRLLSLVDSPRSLALLIDNARLVPPPWPEHAHPVSPAPEALAQQVALESLALRARAGTAMAADLLVQLVADDERAAVRGPAVAAVLEALPRAVAKRRLRGVLPPEEHYRLYETR